MRYTSLVLTSLLAASHVYHCKPLPTSDDPAYFEGFPSEAESISTTSAETTTLAEETTYPGLYPTDTEDFPSRAAETRTTTAAKAVESVTVSATASEAKSAAFPAATGEHSGTEEEHSGANEQHSVANEEEHKPVETSASDTSEEHGAPSDHEVHSGDAESSGDETDSDDETPSHQGARPEHEASPEHDAPSDGEAPLDHNASSGHDASSGNEDWSQHEAPTAEPSPKPHDQDRPCGKLDPWTIHALSRHCDDANTVCGWSFIVDTNCPSLAPTPCSFSIKSLGPGVPASRSPKHEKGKDELCGPYEVHSSWSGQFGPGQGFTTLSVIDSENKLVAYPAYRDDLFGKEKSTAPDVEVAVYALG